MAESSPVGVFVSCPLIDDAEDAVDDFLPTAAMLSDSVVEEGAAPSGTAVASEEFVVSLVASSVLFVEGVVAVSSVVALAESSEAGVPELTEGGGVMEDSFSAVIVGMEMGSIVDDPSSSAGFGGVEGVEELFEGLVLRGEVETVREPFEKARALVLRSMGLGPTARGALAALVEAAALVVVAETVEAVFNLRVFSVDFERPLEPEEAAVEGFMGGATD